MCAESKVQEYLVEKTGDWLRLDQPASEATGCKVYVCVWWRQLVGGIASSPRARKKEKKSKQQAEADEAKTRQTTMDLVRDLVSFGTGTMTVKRVLWCSVSDALRRCW